MSSIAIKNRLLVIGNKVKVPGFEPLSEQTTNNLSLALQGASTFIDLDKALELIPGSRVIIVHNAGPTSGSFGHDKWYEIPAGPPPDGGKCPKNYVRDVYKILQDAVRASLERDSYTLADECNDFGNFGANDCYSDFSQGLS